MSVTITVYVFAANPVTAFVPSPVGVPGCQSYVKVPVPPVAVTEAVPVFPPLHNTSVDVAVNVIDWFTVTLTVPTALVQPLVVTVTLYVPLMAVIALVRVGF